MPSDVKKGVFEMQSGISSGSSFDLMNDEGRAYRGEPALQGLVEKFEAMVEHGEQTFFDVDELEGLSLIHI